MRSVFVGLFCTIVCFHSLFAQNRQISGGHKYSLILCENGIVYGAGDNASGQMGGGVSLSDTSVNQWTPIAGLPSDLVMVDAGTSAHALAIDCNGRVWSWGNNNYGQTGITNLPLGPTFTLPHTVPGIGDVFPPVVYVSGGDRNSYAITSVTGNVLAWGSSNYGLLGNGNSTSTGFTPTPTYVLTAPGQNLKDIVQIEAGDLDCYALDKNGNVWAWGDDFNNSLGLGTFSGYFSPFAKQVMADYDGDNVIDGPLRNITLVSAGDNHGIAIDADGVAWSWGGNWGPGQLGRSGRSNFAGKVKAASDSLSNFFSSLPTNNLDKSIFTSAGQASSLFLLQNTRVVSTGANALYINGLQRGDNGSLGIGVVSTLTGFRTKFTLTPTYVKTGPNTYLSGIQKLADGDGHYFAVDSTGKIYVWGYNRSGNLGLGHNEDVGYATQISLPSGCFVKKSCPMFMKIISGTKSTGEYVLTTNQLAAHYIYTWSYRASAIGNWQILKQGVGTSYAQTTTTLTGWYKLTIGTSTSGINCSSCSTVQDSVSISIDCSKTLELGADKQVCAPFQTVLTTTLLGGGFSYTWDYKPSSTSGWNTVSNRGTGTLYASYKASNEGLYRLRVQRPSCPDALDSLQIQVLKSNNITPLPTSSYCAAQRVANFAVASPSTNIYWYSDSTLSSILNPGSPSKTYTTTTPGILGTSSNCYGKQLYVRDGSITSGSIWKDISTSCGLSSGSSSFPSVYKYLINVTKPITIDSISVLTSSSFQFLNPSITVNIFNESSVSSNFCGVCGPSNFYYKSSGTLFASNTLSIGTIPLNTITPIRLSVNTQLPVGRYWVQLTSSGIFSFYLFTCNPSFAPNSYLWNTPARDNTGLNGLEILTMETYNIITNNSSNSRGNIYNIKYSTQAPASCKFYPVCATTEFIGTPSSISVPPQYCPKDSLELRTNTVPGAIQYVWSAPPGGTILSAVGPTATIVGGTQSGKISVTPIGTCNTGTGYAIDYVGSGAGNVSCSPPGAFTITGLANVVAGQSQVVYTVPFQNGYSYQWTLPLGATGILNAEQNRMVVRFGTTSGNVSVTISNAYGSVSSALFVSVGTVTTVEENGVGAWNIYPNPTQGMLELKNVPSFGVETIEIVDVNGKVLHSAPLANKEQLVLPSELKSGVYVIKIHTATGVLLKRFVLQRD